MTSVRKRKMARSSVSKASRKNKDKQRRVNISSNPIIAKNWDQKLTLKQNYEKLGLRSNLGKLSGGIEKKLSNETEPQEQLESNMESNDPADILEGEAKIVRDDKGEVVKVIYGTKKRTAVAEENPPTEVVAQLEELSRIKTSKPRELSDRETEWIRLLIEKHGDNFNAMQWDRKLNVFQHSAGNLKKRVQKYQQKFI